MEEIRDLQDGIGPRFVRKLRLASHPQKSLGFPPQPGQKIFVRPVPLHPVSLTFEVGAVSPSPGSRCTGMTRMPGRKR